MKVVLHPLAFSRTDVTPNPRPLLTVWGGPLIGVALPLMVWAIAAAARIGVGYLLRFFAGFCLVANGVYIGAGSFAALADAGEMLRHGSPRGLLWLFGAATTVAGFALWHRQGERFGLGQAHGRVDGWAAYASAILLTLVVIAEARLGTNK